MKTVAIDPSPWSSAEARIADVSGQRVALLEQGSGPPLLMLPAAPAWSFIYREFMARLAPRFRCIVVDFPGFGLSPEPVGPELSLADMSRLVERLLQQLELETS